MSRVKPSIRLAILTLALAFGPVAAQQQPLITGASVSIDSIARNGELYEYWYSVKNPAANHGSVELIMLDVSAPYGQHPSLLPSAGRFVGDGTVISPDATAGHVPFGFNLPAGWSAAIIGDGVVHILGAWNGQEAIDRVGPGQSRGNIRLTSPYLPGVRRFDLDPEVSRPVVTGEGQDTLPGPRAPRARDFRVTGLTLAPQQAPAGMSLGLISQSLDRVCALGWISHAGTCHSLAVKLDHGNIDPFLHELDAQRGKKVNEQAYWLLRTNVEWLRDHP